MTASDTVTAPPTTRDRGVNITLWVVQLLLAVFFLAAAAGPKLFGEQLAVEMFAQMGAGQWFRYLVGTLELAGAIGLLIPRLAGLAALCLSGLMVGAALTQVFWLDAPAMAVTPVILFAVFGLIAWGRWPQLQVSAHRAATQQ